jgi:elongation factor G
VAIDCSLFVGGLHVPRFSIPVAARRRTAIPSRESIRNIRNFGIVSHIDAGKTTVSERILFYSGETHKMGEVHDGQAVMDWMPQEQERGITITATTTTCRWNDCRLNLIDTPGHIDFTIEVERSMRVLDGAVAIFSAVEGVQPQSELVWRQADRYSVPRICFINKIDRIGSDYQQALRQVAERLKARPVLLQLPMGEESAFSGVIDLLTEEAVSFSEADLGRTVLRGPIPEPFLDQARQARLALTEAAADFDDQVMADFLEGTPVSQERLREALRRGTLACQIFPVLLGSALRNKGIQPLLDAVCDFLPAPQEAVALEGRHPESGELVSLTCDPAAPLQALAFKVMAEEGRRLTYLRIYSGTLRPGAAVWNSTQRATERVKHLFHIHSHKREEIPEGVAGDIVAVTGCQVTLTGDTLSEPGHPLLLEGLSVPEPVVSLAVEAKGAADREHLLSSLEKFSWEDPTLRVHEDRETGQTILTGMGELHLEIVLDRLRREYGVQVQTGRPRVVYRETLRRPVQRREVFQREAGAGRPETADLLLRLTPQPRGKGVRVQTPPASAPLTNELMATLRRSLQEGCQAGCRTGYPLTDLKVEVLEIPVELGVPSEATLWAAAQRGVILAAREAGVLLLEPIMALELEVPTEHLGKALGSLQQKRGRVEGMQERSGVQVVRATVPLAEMFGYMTELRSLTKGRGSYTMEFKGFEEAPTEVQLQFGLQ